MPSLALRVSVELVFRRLEHELHRRRQSGNGVGAEEGAKKNHQAQLLIAVEKWNFERLFKTHERIPLRNLHVRPDYESIIEEKQELALIRERHGAQRAFVVLRGTKSLADFVDNVKIPLCQLHTRNDGRGSHALAVVRATVREYGKGSVSVLGHSLEAGIALVASSELANS